MNCFVSPHRKGTLCLIFLLHTGETNRFRYSYILADILTGGFMELEKRKPSGREKDEASIKLLGQLRAKLYADDASARRRTAFNLSWMQDDGLDILKEALFSKAARGTKSAAAYGLRKVNGRMKKVALEVFKQGLKRHDRDTREVCRKALLAMEAGTAGKSPHRQKKAQVGRLKIREIPAKSRQRRRIPRGGKSYGLHSGTGRL